MKNGLCPRCNGTDVYCQKNSRSVNEMITLKDAFIGQSISPDKYICAACGLIEYYLPTEKDCQFVRDNWEKVAP